MIAMFVTIALGIVQMPDTQANAFVITIDDDTPHPQAQSNDLPTISIREGTEYGFISWKATQRAPFILTRSDAAAGTLTVDVRVAQDEYGGYVANENLGEKTLTLEFDTDGTARYEVPTLIHSHHENGRVDVEILADTTDPAEYSIGAPSSASVTIAHQHEPTPVPDPTATPVVTHLSVAPLTIWGPDEAVPEGGDAEFTIAVSCGACGDVTINLRVLQTGDYIDTHHYDSPDEHHHDEEDEHEEDEHEEDENEEDEHEEDEHEEHEHIDDAYQFQTVVIPNGSDRTTFSVPTVDDDIAEADGRVIVFILSVDNAWTSGTRVELPTPGFFDIGSATILNDDLPAVTVSTQDDAVRTEGDDVVFQLDRTGPNLWSEVPVRVQPAYRGNFLRSSDQSTEATTVTIPANQLSTTHTFRTVDDSIDEMHGSVTLTVLDDAAESCRHRIGEPTATVVVDDPTPDSPLDIERIPTVGTVNPFDSPFEDEIRERLPITKSMPVPQNGSVTESCQRYRVGDANTATVTVADDDPLDLRFDDPDDATRERVPITKSIPVPQSGSVRYTLKLSRQPTSDVTVRIESDNPGVIVQPSQIIFSAQPPQTLSISHSTQTSQPQTSTFSARSSLAPDIAHAMYIPDSQASILTVPWDYPAPVNIIPKQSLTSGVNAKLTHRLNCLVNGSGCGYSGAEEYIFVQVAVARPLISRIEPKIRNVTVSPSDDIVLGVNIFGRQNIQDQSLGTYFIEWRLGNDRIQGYIGPYMTYTAPSAPGTYTVNARVAGNACSGDSDDCSAKFEIRVRRPSLPQPEKEPPINPPGQIPSVIVDADGNQYEVFTPEQGGKFDNAERYSIAADPGAVPNGEIVGVRMSETGAASNSGMTQHRYTLGGNSYAIHIVDASGNEINAYRLDDPADVCMPLPHELRSNISDLALVSINSNDTLTILSARVRLNSDSRPSVCGNLSSLPVTVAVGSRGTPVMIPVPTPEPPDEMLPETGAPAPSSNTAAWLLILGILIAILTRSHSPQTQSPTSYLICR